LTTDSSNVLCGYVNGQLPERSDNDSARTPPEAIGEEVEVGLVVSFGGGDPVIKPARALFSGSRPGVGLWRGGSDWWLASAGLHERQI
jgi:hypothetical protein